MFLHELLSNWAFAFKCSEGVTFTRLNISVCYV